MAVAIERRPLEEVNADIDRVLDRLTDDLASLARLRQERKKILAAERFRQMNKRPDIRAKIDPQSSARMLAMIAERRASKVIDAARIRLHHFGGRRLPPMTSEQRADYQRMMRKGVTRPDAIAVIFKPTPQRMESAHGRQSNATA